MAHRYVQGSPDKAIAEWGQLLRSAWHKRIGSHVTMAVGFPAAFFVGIKTR